jgi:hypothetical protein
LKKLLTTTAFAVFLSLIGTSQIITTICGNGVAGYTGDGNPASAAQISHPNQLCFDQDGNLFIAEDYNNIIRKIDVFGNISTVAGNGTQGFSGDGGLATSAQINRACGVAVDAAGNLYICDADNFRIRKVDTAGNISTIAGTGTPGYSGDGAAATLAEIGFTSGICLDTAGNIYIASQNNGPAVRKINTSGIISTYAGNGTSGSSGDLGPATSAQLNSPASVFLDGNGNLFIGDLGGMKVRKVNSLGIISTFAGNGSAASGGDGMAATSAQLLYPYDVTADAAGNVYICESGNNKIRKVNTSGIMSTFAGVGGFVGGYDGDGGPAINAHLYHPSSIAIDAAGDIYIGDYENNAIRKVTFGSVGITDVKVAEKINVYPNPAAGLVNIALKDQMDVFSVRVFDITSQMQFEKTELSGSHYSLDFSGFPNGIYFVEITSEGTSSRIKLVKN